MNEQTNMKKGFLKEKLGDYQVDPPEHLWNGISRQVSSGRNRRGFYILLLASAASIALAITLGIHFFAPDLPQQQSYQEELPVDSSMEQAEEREALPENQAALAQKRITQVEIKSKHPLTDPEPFINPEPAGDAEPATNPEPEIDPEPAGDLEAVIVPDLETEAFETPDPDPVSDVTAGLLPDTAVELPLDPFPFMEQEKKRDPRWMIGAAVSPLYSYRDAEDVAMTSSPGESGLLSYSTGIHVSYRRNSRLAFETGIYYNKTGIAIGAPEIKIFSRRNDEVYFAAGSDQTRITATNNSVGNIVAYSGDIYMNGYKINAENGPDALSNVVADDFQASESGIEQHLDFLELPFNLRYSVIDRTIELQLVGGMSTNFLVSNYVSMDGPSGREEIGYLSNVNTVNLSGNAGVGMIYHVSRRFSFLLEPRFRYFLNSVNDSSLPSTRPYSLGIYTGLSYTF